jgi:hypothetical protein
MSLSAEQFLATAARFAGDNGAKPDSSEAYRYLNAARQLLWTQGDWEGTMLTGFVHLNDGCFLLAYPGEIIKNAYKACSNVPTPIIDGSSYWSNVTNLGQFCNGAKAPFFRTGQTYPLLQLFPAGHQIGFSGKNTDDSGTEITVKYETGCGVVEEKITLDDKWGCFFTEGAGVQRLLGIYKPKTKGKVQVLSRGPCGGKQVIHEIHPEEIAPQYQQYQVTSPDCGCVIIRVKKKFVPIETPGSDINLNPTALEWAMKAIVSQEADDLQGYSNKLKFAREHLQLEKEDFTNTITPSRPVVMGDMVTVNTLSYDY